MSDQRRPRFMVPVQGGRVSRRRSGDDVDVCPGVADHPIGRATDEIARLQAWLDQAPAEDGDQADDAADDQGDDAADDQGDDAADDQPDVPVADVRETDVRETDVPAVDAPAADVRDTDAGRGGPDGEAPWVERPA